MELFEAIHSRRSIRKYLKRPVPQEMVDQVLAAAMAGPSAGDQRPWHFIVLDDRAVLDAVADFHPHAAMIRKAPLAIAVLGDTALELHPGYWPQDCSIVTQNILLAAHALGLGAVWLGITPRKDRIEACSRLFGLPDHVHTLAIVVIGWPGEKKKPRDLYDPKRVRRNRWGNA
jgi:nitroreductase